ncbi:MAG: hypothetical protein JJD92_14500 [Frankiaceae bacterium]|nr:hypothetical protein [Frankiaceae bacterium]
MLSLAACGGSSVSPTAGVASVQASPTPAPPSAAPATQATNGHCAITPGVTAAATVTWNLEVQGRNPTIKAGEAVAFVTSGNERPTVTEGMKGTAVANPCIDKVLSANTPVLVTFAKPGTYHLFCRKEPTMMFTAVNVQ